MGIGSITPRIDYAQGNEFFNEFQTLDDIHKPALDGIGYQDSLNWQRAWWDDTYLAKSNRLQTAAGKTVEGKTAKEWRLLYQSDVSERLFWVRLRQGWSIEDALLTTSRSGLILTLSRERLKRKSKATISWVVWCETITVRSTT